MPSAVESMLAVLFSVMTAACESSQITRSKIPFCLLECHNDGLTSQEGIVKMLCELDTGCVSHGGRLIDRDDNCFFEFLFYNLSHLLGMASTNED